MEKLYELIKLAQGERTQNDFAAQSGVSSAALTRILQGTRKPDPDTLKRIAAKAHNGVTYTALMIAAGYIDEDSMKKDEPLDHTSLSPTERKVIFLARRAEQLPEEEREAIVKYFEDTVDLYFKARGIHTEDPK